MEEHDSKTTTKTGAFEVVVLQDNNSSDLEWEFGNGANSFDTLNFEMIRDTNFVKIRPFLDIQIVNWTDNTSDGIMF